MIEETTRDIRNLQPQEPGNTEMNSGIMNQALGNSIKEISKSGNHFTHS